MRKHLATTVRVLAMCIVIPVTAPLMAMGFLGYVIYDTLTFYLDELDGWSLKGKQ